MPMKALSIVLLLTMLASACGGGSAATDAAAGNQPASATATSYIQRCGGCHGAIGSEQAKESLAGVGTFGPDEIEAKIRAGGTQMPSFDNTLTDTEIDAIVRYVIDNL